LSILRDLARKKLAELQTVSSVDEDLFDFVVKVNPTYTRPDHFLDTLQDLEACLGKGKQRICISAPPRHGKSDLLFHLIARYLVDNPTKLVAYAGYGAKMAESKSRTIREYFLRAGGQLSTDSKAAHEWRTTQGGGLMAVGVEGPLTGFGISLLVIDDPYRSRAEAESATIRENIEDWWRSVARTRLEPGGSICITHTRWHPDDLIGHLKDMPGWKYYNFPAITPDGEALWPERFSIDDLNEIRREVGEYDWAALYMGAPRPRGGALFSGIHTYDD